MLAGNVAANDLKTLASVKSLVNGDFAADETHVIRKREVRRAVKAAIQRNRVAEKTRSVRIVRNKLDLAVNDQRNAVRANFQHFNHGAVRVSGLGFHGLEPGTPENTDVRDPQVLVGESANVKLDVRELLVRKWLLRHVNRGDHFAVTQHHLRSRVVGLRLFLRAGANAENVLSLDNLLRGSRNHLVLVLVGAHLEEMCEGVWRSVGKSRKLLFDW